jgi:hypothetical protein
MQKIFLQYAVPLHPKNSTAHPFHLHGVNSVSSSSLQRDSQVAQLGGGRQHYGTIVVGLLLG